jgi:tRNA modification GTPase
VAIVGKTNVGKSTLLNALLHQDKAIVSDVHGTTRDYIEDTTQINGITFRFIDTAGIRKTDDKVELMGIDRSFQKIDEASIILWILDRQPTEMEVDEMKMRTKGKKVIILYNKSDLNASSSQFFSIFGFQPYAQLAISAKYKTGLDELEKNVYEAADIPVITENSVIVTSTRHYEALTRAHTTLLRVIDDLHANFSGDLIAEDLHICLEQLAEITGGQITTSEVLENIFKHFCIGK